MLKAQKCASVVSQYLSTQEPTQWSWRHLPRELKDDFHQCLTIALYIWQDLSLCACLFTCVHVRHTHTLCSGFQCYLLTPEEMNQRNMCYKMYLLFQFSFPSLVDSVPLWCSCFDSSLSVHSSVLSISPCQSNPFLPPSLPPSFGLWIPIPGSLPNYTFLSLSLFLLIPSSSPASPLPQMNYLLSPSLCRLSQLCPKALLLKSLSTQQGASVDLSCSSSLLPCPILSHCQTDFPICLTLVNQFWLPFPSSYSHWSFSIRWHLLIKLATFLLDSSVSVIP